MPHISKWHDFNPLDRKTYPKIVDAPVEVKFDSGETEEATSSKYFPISGLIEQSMILSWRYIRDKTIK